MYSRCTSHSVGVLPKGSRENLVATIYLSLSNCLTWKYNDMLCCHDKILSILQNLTRLYLSQGSENISSFSAAEVIRVSVSAFDALAESNDLEVMESPLHHLSLSDYFRVRRLMEARRAMDSTSCG